MNYIFHNWGDLNLIDRAWFLVGAWLLALFLGVFCYRIIRSVCDRPGKNLTQRE